VNWIDAAKSTVWQITIGRRWQKQTAYHWYWLLFLLPVPSFSVQINSTSLDWNTHMAWIKHIPVIQGVWYQLDMTNILLPPFHNLRRFGKLNSLPKRLIILWNRVMLYLAVPKGKSYKGTLRPFRHVLESFSTSCTCVFPYVLNNKVFIHTLLPKKIQEIHQKAAQILSSTQQQKCSISDRLQKKWWTFNCFSKCYY
jgi:hypothetical protein